ncbi:MAG TPA: hypothetical protein VIC56_04335 [Gemmatimonadota bacterium]|jgi:hypothetical protein
MSRATFGIAALACAAVLLPGCGDGGPFASGPVLRGEWGGEGAVLRASEDPARLDFGCVVGLVRGGIRLDDDGFFARRGAVSLNGPLGPDVHPATFSGRVTGRRMTMNVQLAPGGPEIVFGPLTLERDRPGSLPLCTAG